MTVLSILCHWCHVPIKAGQFVRYYDRVYHGSCWVQVRDMAMLKRGTL